MICRKLAGEKRGMKEKPHISKVLFSFFYTVLIKEKDKTLNITLVNLVIISLKCTVNDHFKDR